MAKMLLTDIARKTGISVSQVSRALNGRPGVAPEIRAAIRDCAHALNYRNSLAPHVPKVVLLSENFTFKLNYFPYIFDELQKRGWIYFQLMCDNWGVIPQFMPDGIINFGCNRLSGRFPKELNEYPVVSVNDYPNALDQMASVLPDADQESSLAVNYLISLGHRRIARIRELSGDEPERWQQRGVAKIFEIEREQFPSVHIVNSLFHAYELSRVIPDVLAQGVTAIIAVNHEPAEMMRIIASCGKQVPRDISVITYENPVFSQWWMPALTTIAFDEKRIAAEVVNLMAENLKERNSRCIVVPSRLIVRESCAPPPHFS